jgi:TPP-dependent 2-oxoacid decarboxylase
MLALHLSFYDLQGIYFVGSTLGAALAAREKGHGRTILFIGDGSL